MKDAAATAFSQARRNETVRTRLASASGSRLTKGRAMLHAILILVGLQCAGDLVVAAAHLPVPGTVIGLLLLLCGLSLRGQGIGAARAVPESLERTSRALHDHFGLLFVPAGAGVVAQFGQLAEHGIALVFIITLSTAATIGITALVAAGPRTARAADRLPAE